MTSAPRNSPWKIAALCAAGFVFMTAALGVWSPDLMRDAWLGHNDFIPTYIAGRLSDADDLYSAETNIRLQERLLGLRSDAIRSMRPPFVAVLAKPLSALPYRTAYLIFQVVNVFCAAGFVWIFARRSLDVAVLASISVPLLMALLEGQDIAIVMFIFGLSCILSEAGHPFAAGLAFSLCWAKFHLFPLTALMLLTRREWGLIRGALAGTAALTGLSFAVAGTGWPAAYWNTLRNPSLNPGTTVMPNLHGLTALTGWGRIFEVSAMCAVAALFIWTLARRPGRDEAMSLALIGGLLLSYHAYAHDALLLLAALGLLGPAGGAPAFRNLLGLSLTPLPFALLSAQNRWSATLTLLVMGAFASGVWQVLRRAR